MSRIAYQDMTRFESWLIEQKGLMKLVARAYTSHVRQMKSWLVQRPPGESIVDGLKPYLERKSAPGQYRTAWNKYVDWCKLEGVHGFDHLSARRQNNSTSVSPWSKTVKKAVRSFARACQVKPEQLLPLTWANVSFELVEGKHLVTLPDGTKALVPVKSFQDLYNWARPASPNDPLIPAGPSATKPLNPRSLVNWLRS